MNIKLTLQLTSHLACRTIFDVLYTRWRQAPKRICMDNGCNLHNFLLNREPDFFKATDVYIDEPHFRGHKKCSPAYNTGVCFHSRYPGAILSRSTSD